MLKRAQGGDLVAGDGKQRTCSLDAMPRGSTPTTSKRSSSADGRNSAKAAKSVAEPPGPPGLTNRLPIRRGSRAGTRRTATSVVGPAGSS